MGIAPEWMLTIAGYLLPLFLMSIRTKSLGLKNYLFHTGMIGAFGFFLSFLWLFQYSFIGGWLIWLMFMVVWVLLSVGLYWSMLVPGVFRPFLVGLVWAVHDAIRHWGVFSFPFGALGYSQGGNPFIRSLAWDGGVPLVAFFLGFTASTLYELFIGHSAGTKRNGNTRYLFFVLSLVLLISVRGVWNFHQLDTLEPVDSLSATFVQPGMDPWNIQGPEGVVHTAVRGSHTHPVSSERHLVVWPETSVLHDLRHVLDPEKESTSEIHWGFVSEPYRDALAEYFLGSESFHLVGSLEAAGMKTFYNTATHIAKGQVKGTYRKVELVPFAEASAGISLLDNLVYRILPEPGIQWIAGNAFHPLNIAGWQIATPICYEDLFPRAAVAFRGNGAQVLLGLNNGEWAGSLLFLQQHENVARFRAIETGLAFYRSGNNGMSAGFSPSGRLLWRIDSHVLSARVYLHRYNTLEGFYSRFSSYMDLITLALVGTISLVLGLTAFLNRGTIQ